MCRPWYGAGVRLAAVLASAIFVQAAAAADDADTCENRSGDAAIAACTRAIASRPAANLYFDRAFLYGQKGDLDRAIADDDQAIRLDPKYAGAYNNRGVDYMNKGDFARAIADLDQAIRLDPKNKFPYTNRGLAELFSGALPQALADLDRASQRGLLGRLKCETGSTIVHGNKYWLTAVLGH